LFKLSAGWLWKTVKTVDGEGDNHAIFKVVVDQGSLIRKNVGLCPYEGHYKLSHGVSHWLLN